MGSRLGHIIALCIASLCFVKGETYTDHTVEILDFSVPRYPKAGDDVMLTCRFRLGGSRHTLYRVNWWRGKDQFFLYKNSDFPPKRSFNVRGINVVVGNSSEDKVVLKSVGEETSGLYKCEVIGERPAFKTAVDSRRMTVIVPPRQIEISHWMKKEQQNVYQIDDFIQLNCTAFKVKPRPLLVWRINGIEVKRTEMKRYPDLEDHRGLVTSTLALRFLAARYFINRMAKVSCKVVVQGHEFYKEEELSLNPSAAFDLYSSGGWRGSMYIHIIYSILLLTNYTVDL